MTILSYWLQGLTEDEDMARRGAKSFDQMKVDAWVARLKLSVRDAAAFKTLFSELESAEDLSVSEVIGIAHGFSGGPKAKSRKAALTAVAQERQRIAHSKAKGESAAKTRVW